MAKEDAKRAALLAFGCLAAAFALYGPVLSTPPVYDDISILLLASPRGGVGLLEIPTLVVSGFWRPVPLGFCWLWIAAFGASPLALHIPTVVLHALNATLAAACARRMGFGPGVDLVVAAAVVAHFGAWHAVASLQTIMDAMLAAWLLAAFAVLQRPTTPRRALAVAGLFLLAAGTKETAVVFPVVAGVAVLCRRMREAEPGPWGVDAFLVGALAALAAVHAAIVLLLQATAEFTYAGQGRFDLRPQAVLRQAMDYGVSLVFPYLHAARSPFVEFAPGDALLWAVRFACVAVLGALAFAAWRGRFRQAALLLLAAMALVSPAWLLAGGVEGRYLYPAAPFAVLAAAAAWRDSSTKARRAFQVAALLLAAAHLAGFSFSPTVRSFRATANEVGAFTRALDERIAHLPPGSEIAVFGHPHPGPPELQWSYANGLLRLSFPDRGYRMALDVANPHAAMALRWTGTGLVEVP